jgi:uncharacterized protein YdhG (YjbR/CyaY superfamily)
MAEKSATKKTTGFATTAAKGFTADERAAMKERARELKSEARANQDREAGERDLLEKIAQMPDLMPKTWYGMPAYARDGKIVCFFKSADKFKSRYATIGFEESAHLDDGTMWQTSFAVTKLSPADEKKIAALVKKAVS